MCSCIKNKLKTETRPKIGTILYRVVFSVFWLPSLMACCHFYRNRLFEESWEKNVSAMVSPEAVIWKPVGSNWRPLTWLDQNWSRNTAQLSKYHSWTTSFNETTAQTDWWLKRRRSWSTSTRPQTTVYGTRPLDHQECWEGHAKVKIQPLMRNVGLFVILVICDIEQ